MKNITSENLNTIISGYMTVLKGIAALHGETLPTLKLEIAKDATPLKGGLEVVAGSVQRNVSWDVNLDKENGGVSVAWATPVEPPRNELLHRQFTPVYRYRVAAAIENTKAMPEPVGYWKNTLASRQPNAPTGSRFDKSVTEEDILAADWADFTAEVDNPIAGCTYLRTEDLTGKLGVIPLADVIGESIHLEDPKGTGKVSATISRDRVPSYLSDVWYSFLILGKEDGVEVVYTLHPGDPISPSRVPAEGLAGQEIPVYDAIDLGLEYAKIEG